MTTETVIVPPFTVHSVVGYGRTAWQVRAGGGHIVGRLVVEKSAREVARLLNLASAIEAATAAETPQDGSVHESATAKPGRPMTIAQLARDSAE